MLTAGLPTAPPRAVNASSLAALAAGCIVLAALAWLAIAPTASPPARAAPPALGRMLKHVSVLAAAPRPIATSANAQARDYILDQLRGMGLAPQVQKATVQKAVIQFWGGRHVTLGVVHNIVVRLPGSAPDRARRPALLLAAHYDTGNTTLGAARSGAQVAALLETARSLRAGPAHANDILMLFADGENVGALGAQGFAEQHRLARQVGLTLRFDSAGSSGPLVLYDATKAGGAVLRAWAAHAPEAAGSSLTAGLFKLLPSPMRIGPLSSIDAPALLFVNMGRGVDWEGRLDTLARLDPAMLAQLQATMLRLARHFGSAQLERGAHVTHSYFSVPGLGAVQHPVILSWGLAALAGLMLVRAYGRALAQAESTAAPLVQGFFGMAVILLAARMVLWERREELGALTRAQDSDGVLAFAFAGGCLFVAALYLLRRLAGSVAVFLGAMAWVMAALVTSLLVAPGTSYLLAWPLAAALCAFTALQVPRMRPLRFLVLAGACAPVLLLFPGALVDAWTGLAPHDLYVPAVVIAVVMLCFASLFLLLPAGPAFGAVVALVLAGCLALPRTTAAPTPAEPAALEPNRLVYFKDMNSWRAYWLLPPQPLDAWSRQLFPNLAQPAIHVDVFGWHSPRQWYAIAPREDRIAFPEAYMLRNPALGKEGAMRQVQFTLRSKNRAPHVELWVAGTKPHRSTVNGRVLTASESVLSLSLYGMEDSLLRFTLDAKADELLAVVVQERMPGLPTHLLPPGAPARMPGTGTTISSDVLRFY